MSKYPRLVVPTPTFSNVPKALESSTDIDPVVSAASWILSFVGLISDPTLEIATKLSSKYIPWFLWSTLICLPSVSVIIPPSITSTPVPFRNVVIPKLLTNWIDLPTPVIKSPWILSTIIWLRLEIFESESLAFVPTFTAPILEIPRTSPIWYPLPPEVIVAPSTSPLLIVMVAAASLPLPVIVSKITPEKVAIPADGVYPIPALMIFNEPVAIPAFPA